MRVSTFAGSFAEDTDLGAGLVVGETAWAERNRGAQNRPNMAADNMLAEMQA
jgi:hypothetical protein